MQFIFGESKRPEFVARRPLLGGRGAIGTAKVKTTCGNVVGKFKAYQHQNSNFLVEKFLISAELRTVVEIEILTQAVLWDIVLVIQLLLFIGGVEEGATNRWPEVVRFCENGGFGSSWLKVDVFANDK